ncbi:MAG: hypothetical protein PHV61_04345 [Limnochordia bacterium]|jgi:flagellar operon protein|nr:hypothetical protein [Limnochordia bacterium]MDD2629382.1 hypothetical protein [Limnochordia bacterium]MDD4517263.1 hypothetical protein [Limnochordia bacterium]
MIQKVSSLGQQTRLQDASRRVEKPFDQILNQTLNRQGPLQFSAHAQRRMVGRNVSLTQEQMQRLDEAVGCAAAKGLREPLVLIEDVAMVVSVTNRTVITVLRGDEARQTVFTNIDGAVIG